MLGSNDPRNNQDPAPAGLNWFGAGVVLVFSALAGLVLSQLLDYSPAGPIALTILLGGGAYFVYCAMGGYRNAPLNGGIGGSFIGLLLGVAVAYANVGLVFPGPTIDLCWYPACAIPGMLIGGVAGWFGIRAIARNSGHAPSKDTSANLRRTSEGIKEGDPPYRPGASA
jgi:hypothetical protein